LPKTSAGEINQAAEAMRQRRVLPKGAVMTRQLIALLNEEEKWLFAASRQCLRELEDIRDRTRPRLLSPSTWAARRQANRACRAQAATLAQIEHDLGVRHGLAVAPRGNTLPLWWHVFELIGRCGLYI
jgi:hypothetical protein